MPYFQDAAKETKLDHDISKFIVGNKDKHRVCRYFLIIVLLARIHHGSFMRAKEVFIFYFFGKFQNKKKHRVDYSTPSIPNLLESLSRNLCSSEEKSFTAWGTKLLKHCTKTHIFVLNCTDQNCL